MNNTKFNKTFLKKGVLFLMYIIRYLLRMESSTCSLKDAPTFEVMFRPTSFIDSLVTFNKNIQSPLMSSQILGHMLQHLEFISNIS
jgi:hypothetical protein